ncbi:hypothetical protein [Leeuwenhoekiella aestuarii]|uniref:Uncharacterized protein n=1 Tax=Leeuwenhoekiella aestuarii TaxID=2249426 RepID=A0A4Q0NQU5_9FLAO|nr:hypothetical protein [Leeuwenhoekiella aestuarii]RXG13109.1 hypothetical protein DSM04_10587 [Leeuwenhoekiella aestuarii]
MVNFKCAKNTTYFLAGVFGSFLFVIIGLFCFNWCVDPYFKHTERIKGFNDKHANYGVLNLQDAYKLQHKSTAKISFIGTSNLLRSISNCASPFYERISATSASIEETSALAIRIAKERPQVHSIFMEVSKNDNDITSGRKPNWIQQFWSFHSFRHSLQTLKSSTTNKKKIDSCYIPSHNEKQTINNLDELYKVGFEQIRPINQKDLNAIKNADWQSISSFKSSHTTRFIFFISPIPYELRKLPKVDSVLNSNKKILTNKINQLNLTYPNITFSLYDLNDTSICAEFTFKNETFHKGWYDQNHYKKTIGDQIIDVLDSKYPEK